MGLDTDLSDNFELNAQVSAPIPYYPMFWIATHLDTKVENFSLSRNGIYRRYRLPEWKGKLSLRFGLKQRLSSLMLAPLSMSSSSEGLEYWDSFISCVNRVF